MCYNNLSNDNKLEWKPKPFMNLINSIIVIVEKAFHFSLSHLCENVSGLPHILNSTMTLLWLFVKLAEEVHVALTK